MAENPDRPRRPGEPPKGNRPGSARPAKGRAGRRSPHSATAGRGRDAEPRVWTRDGKPARGDKTRQRQREVPEDRDPFGIKSVRGRHNDPVIPEDVQAKELDRVARAQLKTLSKENAEEVARHLVMAARLIGDDPTAGT